MNELLFWERLVHELYEWETWCTNDFWHKRTRTMLGDPRGPDSHISFWTFLLLFFLNRVICNRFYFCFSALWCLYFLLFSSDFFFLFLAYLCTEISFSSVPLSLTLFWQIPFNNTSLSFSQKCLQCPWFVLFISVCLLFISSLFFFYKL